MSSSIPIIHTIIDTNIYTSDPNRSQAAFKGFKRIAENKKIKLYIPYIVEREFLSQRLDYYNGLVLQVNKGISKLLKIFKSSQLQKEFGNIEKKIKAAKNQISNYPAKEFHQWTKAVGAKLIPIGKAHTKKVLDDYFNGSPPFKRKKNRKDIPDSFIWQAIKDISKKVKTLYVITNDNSLYSACGGSKSITAFKTLDEFMSSSICQQIIRKQNVDDNLLIVSGALKVDNTTLVQALQDDFVDKVCGQTVESEEIPEDNFEGTIFMANEPDSVDFAFDKMEYYGDGYITIPFKTIASAYLVYAIFKSDYYILDEDRQDRISISERNNRYYEAEEEYNLSFKGVLSIKVNLKLLEDKQLDNSEVNNLIDTAEIEIDSINQIDVVIE